MRTFWLTFTDGSTGACDGMNEYDAKKIAEHFTGKKVAGSEYGDIAAKVLPYPTSRMIWQFEHQISGKCPGFCHQPATCAGRTACPRPRACDD